MSVGVRCSFSLAHSVLVLFVWVGDCETTNGSTVPPLGEMKRDHVYLVTRTSVVMLQL